MCAQELAEHRRHEYRPLCVVIRLVGLPQHELVVREELGLRARARRRRVSVHDSGVMGRSFDEIARASGSGAASVTSASSSGSHERSSGFMPNAGLNAARHAGWGDEGSVVPCARARALSPSRVAPHGSLLRNFDVIIWFIRIGLPPSALVATFCRFRFGALIGYERAKRGRAGAEARACESSRSIRDTKARANLECLAHARADREHARHQRRADHFNVARAQLKRRATQERESARARQTGPGCGARDELTASAFSSLSFCSAGFDADAAQLAPPPSLTALPPSLAAPPTLSLDAPPTRGPPATGSCARRRADSRERSRAAERRAPAERALNFFIGLPRGEC